MTFRKNSPQSRWGDASQKQVRLWLDAIGYFVIPEYAIEDGGAPVLISYLRKKRHVLPDLLVAGFGASRWAEVKYKDSPVAYQKAGGDMRHGIDLPHWRDYLTVCKETGIHGDLFILQKKPGAKALPFPMLLWQSLSRLSEGAQIDSRPLPHAPGGMVYWSTNEFERCPIDFNDPPNLETMRKVIHPWETSSTSGKVPQMKIEQKPTMLWDLWSNTTPTPISRNR